MEEQNQEIITLNVGGQCYSTLKETLKRYSNSLLNEVISNMDKWEKDENGHLFFNRDGALFRHVLNYLRNNRLILPNGFRDYDILREEARYFRLHELERQIHDFINASLYMGDFLIIIRYNVKTNTIYEMWSPFCFAVFLTKQEETRRLLIKYKDCHAHSRFIRVDGEKLLVHLPAEVNETIDAATAQQYASILRSGALILNEATLRKDDVMNFALTFDGKLLCARFGESRACQEDSITEQWQCSKMQLNRHLNCFAANYYQAD